MDEAVLGAIRQRNEFIRYIEFLCRENLKSSGGDRFKKLVSEFYLWQLGKLGRISMELDFIDGLGSLDRLRALLLGYSCGSIKKKEFFDASVTFLDEHKDKNDGLAERALRMLLLFCDLSDDKELAKLFGKKYSSLIGGSTVLKDYLSVLLEEKQTDLGIENWGDSRFDLDDLIKVRLLFLGAVKIGEKRAFYLREHYKVVTCVFTKLNVFEVGSNISGDSLFLFCFNALIFKKIGYDEGLFLPNFERINYLKDIVGSKSLLESVMKRLKEGLFVLRIPVVEDTLSKWLPVSLKSFFVRWLVLCFLLWGLVSGFLLNAEAFKKYESLDLWVGSIFVAFFLGGFLVYGLIRNNLSKIGEKND